jgi:hypothetical protein
MSPAQWAVVVALVALALVAIPAAAIGWAAGRRALRAALDPGRLAPVDDPDVRLVVDADTLPVAGRFPVAPGPFWSALAAAGDRAERDVAEATARTEREIADMIAVANQRIPWL